MRLRAVFFVAADHVEIDLGARGFERPQRMRGVIIGPEQPAFLGREHREHQRAFRLHRVSRIRLRQRDDAHGSRSVIVGAVINAAVRSQAVMIVMGAKQHGLLRKLRVAAFDHSDHVIGQRAFSRRSDNVQLCLRLAERARLRFQCGIDRGLKLGRRLAGRSEQGFGDFRAHVEHGNRILFGDGLRRTRSALRLPSTAGGPIEGTTDLAGAMVRIGRDQQRHRAMTLGDHHLGAGVRVARVALAVEDRIGVLLLRLMVEDQNDFAARVDARVIVIVKLGRGDAEAGEDHRSFEYAVVRVIAGGVGSMVALLGAGGCEFSGRSARGPSGIRPAAPVAGTNRPRRVSIRPCRTRRRSIEWRLPSLAPATCVLRAHPMRGTSNPRGGSTR